MSITLELTPEEEELVRNAARATGKPVALFLKERVLHNLSRPSFPEMTTESALWQQLSAAGKAAGRSAKTRAHALGLGVVYERDGRVVEELPDGTIRQINS